MNTLEQLGARIAARPAPETSGAEHELARLHTADTVAAWVAGARTHEGQELLSAAAMGDAGPMGEGLMSRVMLVCALTRLSEIDDIHLAAGTTPGSLIVPAALTLSAALGNANRGALEAAILSGYDAMVRLGKEMGGASILYRGIWPTYFNAPFGVAAVAASLMGLDASRCAHALGLALVTASPNVGQQGGKMARWLLLGAAAKNGVMAAMAARQGFTADLALLDKPFHSVYGIKIEGDRLLRGMAKSRAILEVGFKPWCAARQTMAAVQGLREMMNEGLDPRRIESIKVAVPPAYLAMLNHGVVPGDRSSHMTSLPYQLVLAAMAPEKMVLLDYAPSPTPPEHASLLSRITVEADESLMSHFPRSWPARITVKATAGGGERLVTDIPGDPARSFDEAQLRTKFFAVLEPRQDKANIESLCVAALGVLDAPESATKLLKQIENSYHH